MEPLVSVIIPVYNVARYLREALDSVIGQTYRNLEIIIVDDGSTDGSGSICDEYQSDARVRVIHQENRGLAGARNAGLNAMSGEYAAFLDGDDAWRAEMVQTMMTGIGKNNADAAVCGFQIRHTEGKLLPLTGRFSEKYRFNDEVISGDDALRMLFLGGMNYAVWNKIYRRALWDGVRFAEGRVYEDVPMMFPLFRKCERIQLLPDILVGYRIRSGSITQTVSPEYVRDFLYALQMREIQAEACIPDLLRQDDAARFREYQLKEIIRQYSQWFVSCQEAKSRTVLEEMRAEIIRRKEQMEADNLSLKARMMYQLCLRSPQMFMMAFSVYHGCRRFTGGGHSRTTAGVIRRETEQVNC